ncbi:MAG: AbrB/MazE/SpoVT family DNA-binding domain-containing protein [Chloroflexi bacterium]|nr:AbrB/MazE/SpoVT family DNA-binding domain-containing protein [Chloroflexota bacterium]
MENIAKLSRNGQLTLPPAIRRALKLRAGEFVEMKLVGHSLVVTPKKIIDKDQAYYWSAEWQAAEREADIDILAGRVKKFDTVDELVKELHSRK